jgi:hypothetical protein
LEVNITVEHNGVTYSGEMATVRGMHLGYEDHGIFSANVDFDLAGSRVQGTGHRALDIYDEASDTRVGTAYGMDFLIELSGILGQWHEMKGKRAIVLRAEGDEYGSILGICDLDAKRFFIFDDLARLHGYLK